MILLINLLLLIVGTSCFTYHNEIIVSSKEIDDITDDNKYSYSPIVQCHFLPSDYYECESVEDIPENDTRSCQVES
ncbi:unnamed protein product [Rotaria socialis]|uniref:Uncharacterized protein n=1 Tax=Rotaria socialis TaxID=392032 RepID=A0A821KH62_9BILA|nr:unnamed protein product [Rotaria socialis]CAF4611880.1 unnamed protein product [Rotaria socialis]CAF4735982.1 unnamed protein product [Rotaria socialis]CAF4870649.1 unnamed protein product [Rotaria socialis]